MVIFCSITSTGGSDDYFLVRPSVQELRLAILLSFPITTPRTFLCRFVEWGLVIFGLIARHSTRHPRADPAGTTEAGPGPAAPAARLNYDFK